MRLGPASNLAVPRQAMRVVLAEDSVLLRVGVARLLEDAGIEVVAQAGDFDEVLRKPQRPARAYLRRQPRPRKGSGRGAESIRRRARPRRPLSRGASGSIINVPSQMGSVGYPGRAAYCSTKHAVEGLTNALAVEWAASGIRVNAVAPTFVETPLTRPMLVDPSFRREVERRLPTGRLATVEDVADAVRHLACDASASVTGASLRIDGGWTACQGTGRPPGRPRWQFAMC